MLKRIIAALFLFSASFYAQVDTTLSVQELISEYLEESTTEDENQDLYDLIEFLMNNPINVNEATASDLLRIPFIDFTEASAIIDYREKFGKLFSVLELNNIEILDERKVFLLTKFLTTKDAEKREMPDVPVESLLSFDFRSRAIYDIQEERGFKENTFAGDRFKNYNRLKGSYGDWYNFGVLFEKDAGEKSYADHFSGFVRANDFLIFDNIIIGDYLIEFGQGLVLWSPYAFSKGADAVNPAIRSSNDIISYSSADENQFFRGSAFKTSYNNFSLTAFYSYNKVDANINEFDEITSFPLDGNHRTENELNRKNNAAATNLGTSLNYQDRYFNIGVLYTKTSFKYPLEFSDNNRLWGNDFNFYSSSYSLIWDKIYFSGETSYNSTSVATINSVQFNFTRNLILTTSVRSYPRNYDTFYSNGFGESSNTINEFGIYTGLRWRTPIGLFNLYYDQFKFPYSTFSVFLPSKGTEYLIDYQTRLIPRSTLNIRYKNEKKELSTTTDTDRIIYVRNKNNIRVDFLYQLTKSIRVRSRIEYLILYNQGLESTENGILAFQDIRYRPSDLLTFYGRLVFFDTDSYESRLYQYENDVVGVMSNLPLYGEGYRLYLLAQISLPYNFKLSVKYAETFRPDESSLGSGVMEIEGNVDNRITLQLDYRF